jgi:hypothetical protein
MPPIVALRREILITDFLFGCLRAQGTEGMPIDITAASLLGESDIASLLPLGAMAAVL